MPYNNKLLLKGNWFTLQLDLKDNHLFFLCMTCWKRRFNSLIHEIFIYLSLQE